MVRNGMAIAVLFVATLIVGAIVNYVVSVLVNKTGLSGCRSGAWYLFCDSWRINC